MQGDAARPGRSPALQHARRIAYRNPMRRNVIEYDGIGTDDRVSADAHRPQHLRPSTDVHMRIGAHAEIGRAHV